MARVATARLFVAVDPPAEACEELSAWARVAVAGWRSWARHAPRVLGHEGLHLTLCFLGSRPVAEIDALGGALELCARPVGALPIGPPLWLPPRRPHLLAVEIGDPRGELASLQARAVRELARASGWTAERRRFRPHVTLVRMREGPRPQAQIVLPAPPRLTFTPDAIVLYRSRPTPAGSEYEALAWSPLEGG
jgi:RNA 2',3'-cyclic 3'-phosphodiesterase